MATLKIIRKRIGSVRNTQKITKAMKMVAAAKLRRAQQAVMAVRLYADRLKSVMASILEKSGEAPHPFFMGREKPAKILFLVFTSNRGLCGGFNSNILRRSDTFLREMTERYPETALHVIGRKGRDYFRARKREVSKIYLDYADALPFETAYSFAEELLKGFYDGAHDEVYIAYNRFKSALSQDIRIERLIPFDGPSEKDGAEAVKVKTLVDYIFEPSKGEFLSAIVPRHVATELYRAHRESSASELGARMTAMENATSNAREMIRLLTLQYNRLRQAAITRELMDIVNGAEAIK